MNRFSHNTARSPTAIPERPCQMCGTKPARRAQRTCTEACKKRLSRSEKRDAKFSRTASRLGSYRTAPKPQFAPHQVIENTTRGVPVLDDLGKRSPLAFERINAITYKLTDGTKIRHLAAMGMPGADRSRALAWLMDIGWLRDRQAWIVRVGDLWLGPTSLIRAKRAAVLILQGRLGLATTRLTNPVGYLRFQQAELVGRRHHGSQPE